jgi:hypothetical protein
MKGIYTELRVAFEKAIKANNVEEAKNIWFNKKED